MTNAEIIAERIVDGAREMTMIELIERLEQTFAEDIEAGAIDRATIRQAFIIAIDAIWRDVAPRPEVRQRHLHVVK